MSNRVAKVERRTKESDIVVEIDLDGAGLMELRENVRLSVRFARLALLLRRHVLPADAQRNLDGRLLHLIELRDQRGRAAGHLAAMKASLTASNEGEVAAAFQGTTRRLGARFTGYDTIAGAGGNSCTLHYVTNDHALEKNGVMLLDAGAEVGPVEAVDYRFDGIRRVVDDEDDRCLQWRGFVHLRDPRVHRARTDGDVALRYCRHRAAAGGRVRELDALHVGTDPGLGGGAAGVDGGIWVPSTGP